MAYTGVCMRSGDGITAMGCLTLQTDDTTVTPRFAFTAEELRNTHRKKTLNPPADAITRNMTLTNVAKPLSK